MADGRIWGKARALQIVVFDEDDEATLMATVNAWLTAAEEKEVIDIQYRPIVYGTPPTEHLHAFITYSSEE